MFKAKISKESDILFNKASSPSEIKEILDQHMGSAKLHFQVFEPKEKIYVKMPSKKTKVKICQELLDSLDQNKIHYKLN